MTKNSNTSASIRLVFRSALLLSCIAIGYLWGLDNSRPSNGYGSSNHHHSNRPAVSTRTSTSYYAVDNPNLPSTDWSDSLNLAIKAQTAGQLEEAYKHLEEANSRGLLKADNEHAEFFQYYTELVRESADPLKTQFISTAAQSAEPKNSKKDRLQEIGRKVIQYQAKGSLDNASLRDRISYSTWQMLFAEYSTINPEFGQFSNARWCFEDAKTALDDIENILNDTPEEIKDLVSDPDGQALLMRMDAVRVRQVATQKRVDINYEQERSRLNQLREISKTYKTLTSSLVNMNSFATVGEHGKSLDESKTAMEAIVKLRALSNADIEAYDYYLFKDEPIIAEMSDPSDYEIVNVRETPFTDELVTDLKSLNSQSLFLRSRVLSPEDRDKTELLNQAIQQANAALNSNENIEGLPVGSDESSPLGMYLLSKSLNELGRTTVQKDLANSGFRTQAAALQKQAKDVLNTLEDKLAELPAEMPTLQANFTLLAHSLEGPAGLNSDVIESLNNGNLNEAHNLAVEALELYSTEDTWVTWLDMKRRVSGDDLADSLAIFRMAQENNLIPQNTPSVVISESMAEIAIVLNKLALKVDAQNEDADIDLTQIIRLRTLASDLANRFLGENDQETWSKVQSVQTALVATEAIVSKDLEDSTLQSSFEAGLNARHQCIATIDINPDDVIAKECLIACLRGLGNIGRTVLKEYMDDPIAYFSQANDVEAVLPYKSKASIHTGTPLVSLITSRSEDDKVRQLNKERQTRHLIQGFLDSAFALNFGDPVAAAASADRAAANYMKTKASEDGANQVLAEEYANTVDSFDAEITTYQSALAFRALSHLSANAPDKALRNSLAIDGSELIDDLNSLTDSSLDAKLTQTQSPLVAFALGASLESYAVTLEDDQIQLRELLIKSSIAFYTKSQSLMEILRIKDKYSQLNNLVADGINRLKNPEDFLQRLEADTQRLISPPEISLMIRRHPENTKLWLVYLERLVADAKLSGESSKFTEILEFIDSRKELLNPFVYHLYRGLCLSNLSEYRKAKEQLELAISFADNDEAKVIGRTTFANNNLNLTTP